MNDSSLHKILEELYQIIRKIVGLKFDYYRLILLEKWARITSGIIMFLVITLLSGLFLLFLSVSLAFYLSTLSGSLTLGFLYVALMYLLLMILLIITKGLWLHRPVIKSLHRKLFPSEKKSNDA